jgi:hypothetical protein
MSDKTHPVIIKVFLWISWVTYVGFLPVLQNRVILGTSARGREAYYGVGNTMFTLLGATLLERKDTTVKWQRCVSPKC